MVSPGKKRPEQEILVVEDSRTQAEVLRHLLEEHGYAVTIASNGKQALSLVRESKPALIISDIVMPEMDGYGLCQHIKDDPDLKEIPVILLTQLSNPAVIIKGLQCEADNFIIKPYDEEYLLSRIGHMLTTVKKAEDKKKQKGVNVFFAGKEYSISSERQQMLDLFLSTYETAIQQDMDFVRTRDKLENLNEKLEELVRQRTAALTTEIAGHKRAEEELRRHREHLEDLVKERTAELASRNVQLAGEIAERKRTEDALRQAKEEWERTFDAVPDLIAILDDRHRVMRTNRSMAERLGRTPDECVGLPCYAAVHGTDQPPAFCPHTRTLTDCREHIAEVHENRLGGYFMVSTTPICDEQGKLTGSIHVARDITERKQAEEALRKAHDQLELRVRERTSELEVSNKALIEYARKLERLNEELQDFAFVASHDLQEPLRKIQTFCDMAINTDGSVQDGTEKEYLARIAGSASRMRQLLQDLLQFARTAAKPEPFKEIDLGKTAREAAQLFEEDLSQSGGSVEIENMPHIEADEIQMLRLFQNLIGNALKFRSNESPRIKVYAKLDAGQCEIIVEDNGIGFDQRYAERIFKPFQRLHGRKQYDGTGMGLAICRKIVDWHGGDIRAESEPAKGSRFVISLSMRRDSKGRQ